MGPGNILGEVIRSGAVPTVCLKHIFRQAKRSLIVENAHNIVSGRPLQKGGREDDFFFLEADGEACQKLVCDLVTTRLPRSYGFDPIRDIQVLCPTKMGPCGTQSLNTLLQDLLNPPAKGKPQLQSASRVFRTGDKVMQVKNNYEIVWKRDGGEQGVGAYNGDIGIVESIDPRSRSMTVRMDDRVLVYPAENLGELEPAYAITVHKSQGSEFAAVVLPAAAVPPRLCYRNLFYTGVTRARRLCVVAGRRDTVAAMMANVPPEPALQRPGRAAEKLRPAAGAGTGRPDGRVRKHYTFPPGCGILKTGFLQPPSGAFGIEGTRRKEHCIMAQKRHRDRPWHHHHHHCPGGQGGRAEPAQRGGHRHPQKRSAGGGRQGPGHGGPHPQLHLGHLPPEGWRHQRPHHDPGADLPLRQPGVQLPYGQAPGGGVRAGGHHRHRERRRGWRRWSRRAPGRCT